MPTLKTIIDYCDRRTRRSAFADYPGAWNGLQVENNGTVTKIGAAVDAGLEPFCLAVDAGVDLLIVHHGMFWDPARPLVGPYRERIEVLLRGNCAVYSSHLPLDAHPTLGNNAILARQSGLRPSRRFLRHEGEAIGTIAAARGLTRLDLRKRLSRHYPRLVCLEFGSRRPAEVAFCSGSGNSAVPALAAEGVDTLVTGELREEWFNVAQERSLNLYLCGHYATEVHGVQALAAELSRKFRLPWTFLATGNPL
jgi:dinuclear metal center YbgI/SA1388 family protein